MLRQQLGKRRLRFTDEQRARLAAKAKALGRSVLDAVATIVTPETLLRWHRMLVARKWTHPGAARPGRPPVMRTIRELTLRMAKDNPCWGYTRIVGALANVGHTVARTTVAKILKAAGIAPAPERPSSWRTFLKAHADTIATADFLRRGVDCPRAGAALRAVRHRSRHQALHIVGLTTNPDGAFMAQVARNLTDSVDASDEPRTESCAAVGKE